MHIDYPNHITLPYHQAFPAPISEEATDQYPSTIPAHFIAQYTQKGARVFDPFMGFGTTAFAAEDLGRVPHCIEADGERYEWSAGQLEHWQNIICGDSADIEEFDLPMMDFCMTSPPFMAMYDDWNPLYGGDPDYAGYDVYLARMHDIFKGISSVMKTNALVALHVDDVIDAGVTTPLIADMHKILSKHFMPQAEIAVRFAPAPDAYKETRILMFKKL